MGARVLINETWYKTPEPFDIARDQEAAQRKLRLLLPAGIVIVRSTRGEQACGFSRNRS